MEIKKHHISIAIAVAVILFLAIALGLYIHLPTSKDTPIPNPANSGAINPGTTTTSGTTQNTTGTTNTGTISQTGGSASGKIALPESDEKLTPEQKTELEKTMKEIDKLFEDVGR